MRHTKGSSRLACFSCKGIGWGLILILLVSVLGISLAESTGSFSGRVWNDLNNDGLMDASEPGVADVPLILRRGDTGEIITAISDETGAFLFASLPNSAYVFSVDVPGSMVFARYRKDGGDLRSVLTGEDNDVTRTFVIRNAQAFRNMNIGLVDSAIIKGFAYLDLNYNGNYDEGEPPYAGVVMEVIRTASDRSMGKTTTGEDGAFFFNTIRTGNYRLRAILPDDGSTFSLVPYTLGVFSNLFAARPGRRENSIPSIDAENSMVYEFYVGVAIGGEITGTVFTDENYSGVMERNDRRQSNVSAELVSADGMLVSQTITNTSGVYTFTGVMPGEYRLRFQRKDAFTFTKYRPQEEGGNDARLSQAGDFGETELFAFAMGQTLTDYDAGMVRSCTLGGVFFYDVNDNGLMDEGEGGFTDGLIRLVSQDGEIDHTQNVNSDGSYYFSGVVPTEYTLTYLLPEHAEIAKVVDGGNTLAHQGLENAVTELTLKAGKIYTQPLVGAVKLGAFEGYAFEDLNANGSHDEGEEILSGVTISVFPKDDRQNAATDITDADGLFSIIGLRPDDYILEISLPEGMIFAGDILASSIALGALDAYSSALSFDTLISRASNGIGAVIPASLQASVWLDENRNGSQDTGERKLDGLEYALYDEIRQQYVMTARAGEDGFAVFYNVRPSTYTVSFELPEDALPVSGVGTFTQNGRIMRHRGIEIHAGESFPAISGGVVCTTSIGGTVQVDQADGRSPVAGALVLLYLEGNPQIIQNTTSDSRGMYRFDGLWPGNYVIEVIQPSGLVFIRPNDPTLKAGDSIIQQISDEFGTSGPFPLTMAQDQLMHRVLLTIPAKIGNLVWLDKNLNGLIDGGEPMINGVTVNLLQNGVIVYTTTSNEWGYYEFTDVYPGEYTVEAVAYPELAIAQSVPELQIISSCLTWGDGSLAGSDPFSVTSASVNFFYHLGYTLKEGAEMPTAITEGAVRNWTRPD